MAECAVSSGAGAEKGAPRATDTAAAADVSEESGRSGRDCASGGDCAEHGTESDRIIREYEKIAFADASLGEIKVSDKLRALDQYRAMCERRNDGGEISLVVNYDYGE